MKKHTFQIYSDSKLIGYSNLEHGDPSMGVAHGIFIPTENYHEVEGKIKRAVVLGEPNTWLSEILGNYSLIILSLKEIKMLEFRRYKFDLSSSMF